MFGAMALKIRLVALGYLRFGLDLHQDLAEDAIELRA